MTSLFSNHEFPERNSGLPDGLPTSREDHGSGSLPIQTSANLHDLARSAKPVKIAVVNGSPSFPSKTAALTTEIVERLSEQIAVDARFIAVSDLVPFFADTYGDPSSPIATTLATIAEADFLIAASPIYKGSYTGLFKHVFDLLPPAALADKPVLLVATGGSERHTLALEHQFRPLFGFFQADTLPITIYGHDSEFENYKVISEDLSKRIDRAVVRALPFLSSELREASLYPSI